MDVVSYHKTTCYYVRYSIPIELHKTRGQSHPPFLKYTLDNSGSGPRDGPRDHQDCPFFGSEFL